MWRVTEGRTLQQGVIAVVMVFCGITGLLTILLVQASHILRPFATKQLEDRVRTLGRSARWVRPISAAHNAVGLAGESPVVGVDCLPT